MVSSLGDHPAMSSLGHLGVSFQVHPVVSSQGDHQEMSFLEHLGHHPVSFPRIASLQPGPYSFLEDHQPFLGCLPTGPVPRPFDSTYPEDLQVHLTFPP